MSNAALLLALAAAVVAAVAYDAEDRCALPERLAAPE